jgi:ribonuclease VapC
MNLVSVVSEVPMTLSIKTKEADRLARELAALRIVTAANYVEKGTVLAGRLKSGGLAQVQADLDEFLAVCGIEVRPVSADVARLALSARIEFGRGFGTRKGLNFGDSFAYAFTKSAQAPLLFVGDDFRRTDLVAARPQKSGA